MVAAIKEQAGKYLQTNFNVVTYELYIPFCEELIRIMLHSNKTKAMLVSTRAEALENAIKIARQATNKSAILCFTDMYHGSTLMAMTLTSKISYKYNCGSFAPKAYRLSFPNICRYAQGRSQETFVKDEPKRLHQSALNLVDVNNGAAVIVEPSQGKGDFNPMPQKYLKFLKKLHRGRVASYIPY